MLFEESERLTKVGNTAGDECLICLQHGRILDPVQLLDARRHCDRGQLDDVRVVVPEHLVVLAGRKGLGRPHSVCVEPLGPGGLYNHASFFQDVEPVCALIISKIVRYRMEAVALPNRHI